MSVLPTEEIVTNQAVILDCLNQISENNTPLSLTLRDEENGDIYLSRIQSLNKKKRHIILKQVLPSNWREKITPGSKLEIRSCMNMGNIRFNGLISPLDDTENSPYSKLTLPRKVFRLQLRDYYRISLAKIPTTATLSVGDDSVAIGSCRDISMSGVMVSIPNNSLELELTQILDECSISVEGILHLDFRGKICSINRTESDTLIGMQFLDLSKSELKPIGAALNKIERRNITT